MTAKPGRRLARDGPRRTAEYDELERLSQYVQDNGHPEDAETFERVVQPYQDTREWAEVWGTRTGNFVLGFS
jgi:hypothetical protein